MFSENTRFSSKFVFMNEDRRPPVGAGSPVRQALFLRDFFF